MPNLDPFALEVSEEIVHTDEDKQAKSGARWEHEDLAQVEHLFISKNIQVST